jgi:Xaa-Pro aminopeptidase
VNGSEQVNGSAEVDGRTGVDTSATAPQRRNALRDLLDGSRCDALLVTNLVNVRYLTGFTGTAGAVLIGSTPEHDRFVTDGRYEEQARAQVTDVERLITRGLGWLPDAVPADARLGLEAGSITWRDARAIADDMGSRPVVPVVDAVERLRVVKDEGEIAAIRAACAVADRALAATLPLIRPGRTELEVATVLERAMVDGGAQDRAFTSIVASGPNSAVPHHRPTGRVLQPGDLVKLDFGAQVDGYRSDMTRMLALGEPEDELREVLALVTEAQRAGVRAAIDGATGAEVDAACREPIVAAGHGERFVHGTGHGVGLDIHEAPRLAADAGDTLRSRMVVTVEPGVYLPGRGGVRIEDTLVIRGGTPEILTTTPTDLIVL